MRELRALFLRVMELFRKEKREQEFAAEMESHLEMHIEENLRTGMTEQEARRAALIKLGGVEQVKEVYRDRRSLPMLEIFLQDARYAFRMLRKNSVFTTVVILMIALGTGANTAIFSVVNAAILRPLPFANPERLVAIYQKTNQFGQSSIAFLNLQDWQKNNRSFTDLAGWRTDSFNLTGSGEAEHLSGAMVSASFLRILGVQPVLGRDFSDQEDVQGAASVVLISEQLWRHRFGANPQIVGTSLTLNGKAYTVIGIVPANFRWYHSLDIYVLLGQWDDPTFHDRRVNMGTHSVARMKDGVTLAQANSDMKNVAANLAATYPNSNTNISAVVIPMHQDAVGDLRGMLLVLLGAVGFVLLIACANVANLLLARSASREREFAIRAAIGASRNRVIRQVLTESVLLSFIGGALGILLAAWGTDAILKVLPTTLPGLVRVHLDVSVLLFALGASVFTGILFGLVSAWKISRPNLQETLKEGGRGLIGGSHRTQGLFIVSEIALALILLVGAGLMLRSLQHLWNVPLGFDAHNVIHFSIASSPSTKTEAELIRFRNRQLAENLQSIPGVDSASVYFGSLPMSGDSELPFWLEGNPKPANENDMDLALMYGVDPYYFRAFKIPLLHGRTITAQDVHTAPTAMLIDEEFARKYFPNQDPIGKRVNLMLVGQAEIVGIVGHVKHWGVDGDDTAKIKAQIYLSSEQFPDQVMSLAANETNMVLRTSTKTASIMSVVREKISSINSSQVVFDIQNMEDTVSNSQSSRRFSMILLSGFAAIALLLATIGIYGVVSYLVNQRTHEVGIRMAMGAQPRDILRIVLGQGGKMALLGIVIGVCGSFVLTRLMANLLFGVSATDPLTFGAVALLLFILALAACYLPARRAMHVDPMVALRYE